MRAAVGRIAQLRQTVVLTPKKFTMRMRPMSGVATVCTCAAAMAAATIAAASLPAAACASANDKSGDASQDSSSTSSSSDPSSSPAPPFRSAQPYSHPSHPGLTVLVADTVDELIYNRHKENTITRTPLQRYGSTYEKRQRDSTSTDDSSSSSSQPPLYSVFLDVYDPDCAACASFRPVLLQLADAFSTTPSVRIMCYDDAANYKRGFLTEEETRALPLLKFYPVCDGAVRERDGKCPDGLIYDGPPNARSIVDFIAQHTPSQHAFDMDEVGKRLDASASRTDADLRVAAARRLEDDPVFHLYQHSPCGEAMLAWMKQTVVRRYLNKPPSEEDEKRKFNAFRQCVQQKEKETQQYWERVAIVAQDNLTKIGEKEDEREIMREIKQAEEEVQQ